MDGFDANIQRLHSGCVWCVFVGRTASTPPMVIILWIVLRKLKQNCSRTYIFCCSIGMTGYKIERLASYAADMTRAMYVQYVATYYCIPRITLPIALLSIHETCMHA
ncbi:hypothetical protein P167DRAFT_115698 [Morchella conica CCBAS932]|uniref:Uncharacterized protein n=1 Tax=Morchella conica CCBAS932 TaxID=1392247 RepID=A0A3N4KAR6_9PEZI|nr:hypothetical protein P167DRAFT_115698 [Morchella conica CCBAS932]